MAATFCVFWWLDLKDLSGFVSRKLKNSTDAEMCFEQGRKENENDLAEKRREVVRAIEFANESQLLCLSSTSLYLRVARYNAFKHP